MSETWWGTKTPDSDFIQNENEIVLAKPNYVRTPPELGSVKMKVLSIFIDLCPQCDREVKHYELEEGLFVAECIEHNYLWYKKEKNKS